MAERIVEVELVCIDDYLEIEDGWVEDEGLIVIQLRDSETKTSSTVQLHIRAETGKANIPLPTRFIIN